MQNNIHLLKLFSVRVSNERDLFILFLFFCKLPGKYLFFPYKRSSILECLVLRVLHPSLFRRHVFFWQSFSLTDLLLWGLNFITTYELYLYICGEAYIPPSTTSQAQFVLFVSVFIFIFVIKSDGASRSHSHRSRLTLMDDLFFPLCWWIH